jgi:hypothetical protein
METTQETQFRFFICITGACLFFLILCCGLRQLAILEDRVRQRFLYNQLEQELVEFTDESLEEFEEDSILE